MQRTGGNVGIGTTSPGAKLDVNGSIAIRPTFKLFSDDITNYTGGSTPLTIGTGGAQNLIFNTNAAERMRIDTTGNVGIGTNSPAEKLDVYGGNAIVRPSAGTYNASVSSASDIGGGLYIKATTLGSSSRVGVFFQGNDSIGASIAAAREDPGTTWRTYMSFYTNNSTSGVAGVTALQEKMRITSDGNVGIGTASPIAKIGRAHV